MRFGTENLGKGVKGGGGGAGVVDGISDQIIHFNNKQFFSVDEWKKRALSLSLPRLNGCVYTLTEI